jgi:ubiquinol-cytochrome c reductase cytochrome c1 subunit
MKRPILVAFAALATLALAPLAAEAEEGTALPERRWDFDGPFGQFDRAALQRGLYVYEQVCASCHGLKYVAFRNLTDLGFTEDEAKAIAAAYEAEDGPNDDGDMFMRPARLSDRFPSPFANEKAARAANNGADPPDLSLIVKARVGGADYVYGILAGYLEPPAGFEVGEGLTYNSVMPGNQIAMPPPLTEDQVEYADGTTASVEQMSRDVVQFLAWAAEPKLEARKSAGLKTMLFLIFLTVVTYAAKRRIWSGAH